MWVYRANTFTFIESLLLCYGYYGLEREVKIVPISHGAFDLRRLYQHDGPVTLVHVQSQEHDYIVHCLVNSYRILEGSRFLPLDVFSVVVQLDPISNLPCLQPF